ncbi:hypothetical protein [Nicoliella lavandulae]|uniref:Uncharacterized protein n=1 Tax=Nicoliella lavandulae TaxID=3082954 RepID=A0ABU8SM97_9LACO
MLKVAITNGVKDANGSYAAPTDLTSYAFIASDEKPQTAHIGGLNPGDEVADGQYYVGEFNTQAERFVGNLIKVSAFVAGGDPTPKNITVTATDDGADVTANSSAAVQSSSDAASSAPASSDSVNSANSAQPASSNVNHL